LRKGEDGDSGRQLEAIVVFFAMHCRDSIKSNKGALKETRYQHDYREKLKGAPLHTVEVVTSI